MTAVRLPTIQDVDIYVVLAHVTHTVLDARVPDKATLSVNLSSGKSIECRAGDGITLQDLDALQARLLGF